MENLTKHEKSVLWLCVAKEVERIDTLRRRGKLSEFSEDILKVCNDLLKKLD